MTRDASYSQGLENAFQLELVRPAKRKFLPFGDDTRGRQPVTDYGDPPGMRDWCTRQM